MTQKFYAHSLEGRPEEEWQPLKDHLKNVAALAGSFAGKFGARDWGYLAGLWHDLGKYQPAFQAKLLGKKASVEHSGAGASHALHENKDKGLPLAFIIAGHHTGLANLKRSDPGQAVPLLERIKDNRSLLEEIRSLISFEIINQNLPDLPPILATPPTFQTKAFLSRRLEFWIRFLFSALVDADRLDSEEFLNPAKKKLRRFTDSIEVLQLQVDEFIDQKIHSLSDVEKKLKVNEKRQQVLRACHLAAAKSPGFFALTVPTGGGKTLAALSFAFRHAASHKDHKFRRVIIVIPYTSIIEQNAAIYRQAVGAENVVEHHCNIDPLEKRNLLGEEISQQHELAVENWDAPVIVTTTVQLFESLFSNLPSRCRKLHNIARSIIILDEVQTLPPGYLLSIVEALNELVSSYYCSVVLSTATSPALAARQGFEAGLKDVRPIIADTDALFGALKRVDFVWPAEKDKVKPWSELAEELARYPQVLAVVHRRQDSRKLAICLRQLSCSESVLHLSALMCPAHRLRVLDEIRNRLDHGMPCRVVSTQLVEAGVDVDFPVVYRALGGLDSIIQAAGRCNREGHLKKGKVVVFRASTSPPPGSPRKGLESMETIISEKGGHPDPFDPQLTEEYFRMLYVKEDLDAKQIQALRQEFNFACVGQNFKLIEDGFTKPIIVPYGEAGGRVQRLRTQGLNRENLRNLQPYLVNVYPNGFDRLYQAGSLEQISEGIFVLSSIYCHLYDDLLGLLLDEDCGIDPQKLII